MHGVISTPDVKKCQLTTDDRSVYLVLVVVLVVVVVNFNSIVIVVGLTLVLKFLTFEAYVELQN